MKKIVSLLLTLMLAVGLLTGCTDPKELYDNEDTIAGGSSAFEALNWAESSLTDDGTIDYTAGATNMVGAKLAFSFTINAKSAIVLYAFAILLHVVSWIASLVLIILATGIVYLNIPFLPDSKWDDECEFIKRPKAAPKDGKEQTDIIPSAASLVLQDIMGKYGLPGDEVKASEPENEPSQREPAKPQDAVPKELPVQHEQCESVSNSEKNAILEIKAIQADREDSLLDVSIDDIEPEPEMATVSIKPILDVQEDALEVDLADESNTEISLDLSSDSDGSANFQDAMSLEDELAAMEATLSASHDDGVFNPTDDELGEDEDDSLDLDSMLDVPGSPVDEAPDEPDVTEATKATTPVATEPPADTALPEQKDDSEQLPTKGKRSSRKKQKKDDDTPVTRTNAFQPKGSFAYATICGIMLADPRVRTTPSGKNVTEFRVGAAHNRVNKKTNTWVNNPAYMGVYAWEPLGDFISKNFKQDSGIHVIGELVMNQFTAKDGTKRTTYRVKALTAKFLNDADDNQTATATPAQAAQPTVSAANYGGISAEDFESVDDLEDLPF